MAPQPDGKASGLVDAKPDGKASSLVDGKPDATAAGTDCIRLSLDPGLEGLGAEGYRLDSGPGGVCIQAQQPAGLFHGLQTLRQLLPVEIFREAKVDGAEWTVPFVHIEDQPRFSWRGSHLDVARHFLPKSVIKRHLDLMALHKLNVFHWHLTDDQGWRLEIRKYPKLTAVGAWRKETVLAESIRPGRPDIYRYDNTPHGGYYTQEDVREVVRYAADRCITVVPEIEMPGHCSAALAAYPELGNFPEKPFPVPTRWAIFETVFSPEDRTIAFLRDVLDEVMALFPSHFIHIGGDECPKAEWARSPGALAKLKALGLIGAQASQADLAETRDGNGRAERAIPHPAWHQLQSWFVGQLASHLIAHGREPIGWDEILEGGLAPGAAVMNWHGEQLGIQAAKAGHDVVMASEAFTYLDHYQSKAGEPVAIGNSVLTLGDTYAFEPVPEGLTAAEAAHILGGQGQLWSEYVATPAHMEYMFWPRLAALAEVFWSPRPGRDFPDFQRRLGEHVLRLQALDINYRR